MITLHLNTISRLEYAQQLLSQALTQRDQIFEHFAEEPTVYCPVCFTKFKYRWFADSVSFDNICDCAKKLPDKVEIGIQP